MHVTCITVSVIILMRTPNLVFVDPHARPEVFMEAVNTLIHNGNDD